MKEVDEAKVEKEQVAAGRQTIKSLPAWFSWVMAGLVAVFIALVAFTMGQRHSWMGAPIGGGFDGGMMRGGYAGDRSWDGGRMRAGGKLRGTAGEVTAISAGSITIKDTMRGGSVTYKIDSNTKVTENDSTKAVSDIKTGNTVRVVATGSDTTVATEITLGTN